jgi:hypothetical protein
MALRAAVLDVPAASAELGEQVELAVRPAELGEQVALAVLAVLAPLALDEAAVPDELALEGEAAQPVPDGAAVRDPKEPADARIAAASAHSPAALLPEDLVEPAEAAGALCAVASEHSRAALPAEELVEPAELAGAPPAEQSRDVAEPGDARIAAASLHFLAPLRAALLAESAQPVDAELRPALLHAHSALHSQDAPALVWPLARLQPEDVPPALGNQSKAAAGPRALPAARGPLRRIARDCWMPHARAGSAPPPDSFADPAPPPTPAPWAVH